MNASSRIRNIARAYRIGVFKTINFLNLTQCQCLIKGIIRGRILEEFELKGGTLYPDKTFFIIRRNYLKVGLFSMYITNAALIKYAIDKGYIPLIDMCNYNNCYLDSTSDCYTNSWEFYFKQPYNYTLADAYKGKNIILSTVDIPDYNSRPNEEMDYFNNINGILDNWRLVAKRYMRVHDIITEEANSCYKTLVGNRKCLGVAVRGTDYAALRPPGHPIQPPIEKVIEDAKDLLLRYHCECIYLSTEDSKIIDTFKKEFGDACLVYDRNLVSYTEGSIIDQIRKENINSAAKNGREYLISILMLAKTNVLLASMASSVVGVAMISSGWKVQHIYNLGKYPFRS